jgi:hypothetical protein
MDPRARASALVEELAAQDLRMAALYGSAARDGFDPEHSDVNLLLVFDTLDGARLAALAGPLQLARSAWRCAAFVLTTGELEDLGRCFPIKLHGIRRNYHVLAGADLLAGMEPPPEQLGQEAVRVLRNAAFKLRRAELGARPDPKPALEALRRFLPQLRDVARLIKDQQGGAEDSLVLAERRWDLPEGSLQQAFALRRRPQAPWPEVEQALRTVDLALAAALAEMERW